MKQYDEAKLHVLFKAKTRQLRPVAKNVTFNFKVPLLQCNYIFKY